MALASRYVVRSVSTSPLVRNNISVLNSNRRWERKFNTDVPKQNAAQFSIPWKLIAGAVVAGTVAYTVSSDADADSGTKVDYNQVREDIKNILNKEGYDDGSYGPVFVRLAWHAAGTYNKHDNTGGSDGSTMRFEPESAHGANAGLSVARAVLEKVKQKHPGITYADLWSLAGVVAIESMGGPQIKWRPGRSDKDDGSHCTPDGRLPDATKGADHIREVFYRMGFNDREIVALVGAHALGRCHPDRSGFSGPWTHSPTVFSNDFFVQLLENKWTQKKWNGPTQFEDPTGTLMMLPADLALIQDPEFKKIVEEYAKDEDKFFKDFAVAFQKLEELGVKALQKPWYQFW
jgi:catalase (peroxidase I)